MFSVWKGTDEVKLLEEIFDPRWTRGGASCGPSDSLAEVPKSVLFLKGVVHIVPKVLRSLPIVAWLNYVKLQNAVPPFSWWHSRGCVKWPGMFSGVMSHQHGLCARAFAIDTKQNASRCFWMFLMCFMLFYPRLCAGLFVSDCFFLKKWLYSLRQRMCIRSNSIGHGRPNHGCCLRRKSSFRILEQQPPSKSPAMRHARSLPGGCWARLHSKCLCFLRFNGFPCLQCQVLRAFIHFRPFDMSHLSRQWPNLGRVSDSLPNENTRPGAATPEQPALRLALGSQIS